jgi:hypothetical protein
LLVSESGLCSEAFKTMVSSIRSSSKPGEFLLGQVAFEWVLRISQTIAQPCLGGSQIALDLVNPRQD